MEKIILFMDNMQDFLEIQSRLLEQAGYQVLKASTLEEAEKNLEERCIHLAILDIRMIDEDDEQDISGLVLARKQEYRSIPKIVLTAYPSYEYVRDVLSPDEEGFPSAIYFLGKGEGFQALCQAVERAFVQHVRINWNLRIRWDKRHPLSFPHLITLIEPNLDGDRLLDRAKELEDLFRKLFYQNCQITIGRLLWHQKGRVCVMLFPYSPNQALRPLVVTCGLRSHVDQELDRCKEFAPNGPTGTTLVASAEAMHFAAVAYALSEADLEQVQTFRDFYRTNRVGQVREALKYLFEMTLTPWHREGRILEETKSLDQLYCQYLGLNRGTISQEELERRMLALGSTAMRLSAHELILQFPNGDTVSYPSPIPSIYEETTGGGQPVACRTTPGTLTDDNVLVDQEVRTWLTDFHEAGPAPILWDFISLEATVRFDLVQSADLQALHEFEKRLVEPDRLNERLYVQDTELQFRKALGVIQEIRNQAFSPGGGDPIPYYNGLLFWAMSDVADYAPDLKYTRQKLARLAHVLLAAAMIFGKITQMTLSPSSKGPSVMHGIEIDETNRGVRVKGRPVALSPSEFDVLLYLFNHADQLCERRSIVEEGLKDKYMGNRQEASRINTLMGRLRKKIEPDPDKPRYIITARGKGYMLRLSDEGHP
jgi:DNA-binding response OmpR family regulator